jgi:hypothetical protein
MKSPDNKHPQETKSSTRPLAIAFGLAGGGVLWFLHFVSLWLLGEWACVAGWAQSTVVLWGALATLLAALAAIGMLLRLIRRRRGLPPDAGSQLATLNLGMLTTAFFLLVILVQAAPLLFLWRTC